MCMVSMRDRYNQGILRHYKYTAHLPHDKTNSPLAADRDNDAISDPRSKGKGISLWKTACLLIFDAIL